MSDESICISQNEFGNLIHNQNETSPLTVGFGSCCCCCSSSAAVFIETDNL